MFIQKFCVNINTELYINTEYPKSPDRESVPQVSAGSVFTRGYVGVLIGSGKSPRQAYWRGRGMPVSAALVPAVVPRTTFMHCSMIASPLMFCLNYPMCYIGGDLKVPHLTPSGYSTAVCIKHYNDKSAALNKGCSPQTLACIPKQHDTCVRVYGQVYSWPQSTVTLGKCCRRAREKQFTNHIIMSAFPNSVFMMPSTFNMSEGRGWLSWHIRVYLRIQRGLYRRPALQRVHRRQVCHLGV